MAIEEALGGKSKTAGGVDGEKRLITRDVEVATVDQTSIESVVAGGERGRSALIKLIVGRVNNVSLGPLGIIVAELQLREINNVLPVKGVQVGKRYGGSGVRNVEDDGSGRRLGVCHFLRVKLDRVQVLGHVGDNLERRGLVDISPD